MAKKTAHDEWMNARSRLLLAERVAGIEGALTELNDRNAFIASEEQHEQDRRRIVFGVADLARRKDIIRASRDCHRLCRKAGEEELVKMRARAGGGGESIRSGHLWSAIGLGLFAVFVGHSLWGLTGAIGGAVVAVLVGFDHIRRADRLATADAESARSEVQDQTEFLRELGSGDDSGYSAAEEKTGQPDVGRWFNISHLA